MPKIFQGEIVIQLLGRLGNCMFLFGLGLSLEKKYPEREVSFFFSKGHPEDTKVVCEKYGHFFQNDFGLRFAENAPPDCVLIDSDDYEDLEEINFFENKVLLRSFFQNRKFLDQSLCRERLKCPESISEEICDYYGDLSDFVSVHVRRGDYLESGYFVSMEDSWYMRCMGMFPENQKFIFVSDDMEWCKERFKGTNVFFADRSSANAEMLDMYIQASCRDNIISASSFSWWGSLLNPNPNKIVYAPRSWVVGPDQPRYYRSEMVRI